ncbi:MAG: hypothetical protein ACK51N_01080 [bacterium]|jgi:hypothetical protein|nr:hypothetical protein [Phycisphaerales bacterium]MCE2653837.1 hypothetical protein [Planctomycetaceae bacterium]
MTTPPPPPLPSLLKPNAAPASAKAAAAHKASPAGSRRTLALILAGLAALSLLAFWTLWPRGDTAVPASAEQRAEQIARDLRALDHQPDEQAQAARLIEEARRVQLPGAPVPRSVRDRGTPDTPGTPPQ